MGSSNGGVPPGFRFHPTDEELLHYYLKKKVSFQKFDMEVIREADLNKMEPWELQEKCRIGSTPQNEWYFFSHKDRKYPTGSRTNRATNAGFWKATGRDKCIRNSYKKIGMRKTLVFYRGRAPHGQKTDWIMHEYRLEDGDDPEGNSTEDGWVVCRVFKKKNLFKVGNDHQGGSSNNNADQQRQLINIHTDSTYNNQQRTFMHAGENYYLQRQPTTNQSAFELNKPAVADHHLALQYPNLQAIPHPQYSLFQPHQPLLLSHKPMLYDYSLSLPASSNPRDCESAAGGMCESRTQQMGSSTAGRDDHHATHQANAGMNVEWSMLDRLVVTSQIGNEESSKGVSFEDANGGSSVQQINQLSLRGEMDFWGYDAKQ